MRYKTLTFVLSALAPLTLVTGCGSGGEEAAARLSARKHRGGIVGINVGANKDSADRADDFARVHRQKLARLPGVQGMQSSFALRTVFKTTALPT